MLEFNPQWLTECDSTSRILKDQTKDSFNDVLVLAAARQTAGAGRLGRPWMSLEGNLHLSIALPAHVIRDDIRDVLPLAAGSIVSRWMEKLFSVRPCLKWPNDVLIDGLKVAGILCEATFLGSEFKGVIIGIGVNLKHAPSIEGLDSYLAGSIESLIGTTIPARLAADSLSRFFAEEWPKVHRHLIFDDWRARSVSNGHLWYFKKSEPRDWLRVDGIDDSGNLTLTPRGGGEKTTVSSVHNELGWSFQMDRQMMIADVGNSRTKFGVFQMASDGTGHVSLDTAPDDDLSNFLKINLANGLAPVIHALSVNPDSLRDLKLRAKDLGVDVREISKNPVRATRSLYDLSAIGADRLAILEAMHYRHSKGSLPWPAMGVSCGTATTLDFLDGSGQHLGGFILAGLQTGLDAISRRGALLPNSLVISADSLSQDSWPHDSAQAMIRASVGATMAFLMSERQRLAAHCRVDVGSVNVLLTGGFSELVASQWPEDFVLPDQTLVLLGAGIMAANGR